MNIIGKTVFITGAATGIGLETAKKFLGEGANIVIYSRGTVEMDRSALPEDRVLIIEGDVCDRDAVREAFERSMKQFGSVDVLVNNAGVARRMPFADMTDADRDLVTDVNLKGVFIVSQEALDVMQGSPVEHHEDGCVKKRKCIINISSGAGLFGIPELAVYSATKAGVIAFTQALSGELAQSDIDVIAITPGSVDTGMFHSLFKGQEPHHTPADVAEVISQTVAGKMKPDNRMIVDTFYHTRV